MSEPLKTSIFVALAVLAVAGAYFVDRPTQAVNVNALVGKSLNAELEVDAPKRLQVIKFDRPTAETKQFEVASVDGVWSIPSKQDYPADATQQMAKAATSLLDRKVLRVAAETAQSHEELGVVDPQSAKLDSNSQGVGTRVIMSDADDQTLVDMIIGKKVKDAEGQRYVRNSNQDVVYIVELDPSSLSTNFEDWIEDDLLLLSPFDLRQVFINDYSADLSLGMTADGRIMPKVNWDRRSQITLSYHNEEAKWTLADLKSYDKQTKQMVEQSLGADEEVNQESLNNLRNGLDDLLIVDIARKPTGLSDDLKAGADFMTNREAFQDLVSKGFSPVPLQPGAPPEILSSEGELIAAQRDGVEYVLRFGQLQVHTESADGEAASAEANADASRQDESNAATDAAQDQDGKNLRRYLFVMARFNESIIEKPQLKELPPLPEGAESSSAAETNETPKAEKSEETPAETTDVDDADVQPADEESPTEPAGGDEPEAADKAEPTDETDPAAQAENAEGDSADQESKAPAAEKDQAAADAAEKIAAERAAIELENKRLQEEYDETVAAGKKRVAELNERFGDWYYVISNDVYKQIHLGRDQVFKKKSAADGSAPGEQGDSDNPLRGLPNLPLNSPAAE